MPPCNPGEHHVALRTLVHGSNQLCRLRLHRPQLLGQLRLQFRRLWHPAVVCNENEAPQYGCCHRSVGLSQVKPAEPYEKRCYGTFLYVLYRKLLQCMSKPGQERQYGCAQVHPDLDTSRIASAALRGSAH